jgi:hypothetical protein
VGVVSERGIFVGIALSLGMDTVPLRLLVLLLGSGLGLDARRDVE